MSLPKATNVAAAALQVVTACAAAAPLQEQLVSMAALAPVFTRMLQCALPPLLCAAVFVLSCTAAIRRTKHLCCTCGGSEAPRGE